MKIISLCNTQPSEKNSPQKSGLYPSPLLVDARVQLRLAGKLYITGEPEEMIRRERDHWLDCA